MRLRPETCPSCGAILPHKGPCTYCGATDYAVNCPNCGAPLSSEGTCQNCGATVQGFYRGLNLGRIDIAHAIDQGLDYYMLLGVPPTADDTTIKMAYWRQWHQLPPNKQRLPPRIAHRLELLKQAGQILGNTECRQLYDQLRRERSARQPVQADAYTRGLACYRAEKYDDAARLLRQAYQEHPAQEEIAMSYALSLLYGCSLANPPDWRVDEMLRVLNQAVQRRSVSPTCRSLCTLVYAVQHYNEGRVLPALQVVQQLTDSTPAWHLPWIIGGHWFWLAKDMGTALAWAEQSRRRQPADTFVRRFQQQFIVARRVVPDEITRAAHEAARLLGDGTAPAAIERTWSEPVSGGLIYEAD